VKEGYDQGHPYFSIRYGGGPSQLCPRKPEHHMVETTSDCDSGTELPGPHAITLKQPGQAPRAARWAFAVVGFMEGLELRTSLQRRRTLTQETIDCTLYQK
jgi:hypothetical protein